MGPLSGKKGLVIGIANEASIAYGCAQACFDAGAELAATYLNDKAKPHVQPLTADVRIPDGLLLPFDVTNDGELEAVFESLQNKWGHLDFVVHAMASATKAMTRSRLLDVSAADFNHAMLVSCHSFLQVAKLAEPLMAGRQSTLITMTYLGAQRAIPNYQFMGPMKAALESCVRYLALELGEQDTCVHALAPSAMATRAASGIQEFDELLRLTESRSPRGKLTTPREVGELCAFLVGNQARGMTGGIHQMDGGFNITA